ncbi:hypothetical protein AKJ65_02500 [candidate division MSBL1 archaeon SCGC-AAA259E19]|uniref:Nmd3 N-terminal domain-containing protein n=1 Tax=candidate division MSBL1 archaeon SCGC-AAA259E19 TaxID=1698264 RepID=A0A133ULT3_9EURY|nr:hypothetical protein AKJ65_02500 [candidate division MSBL1 archaeon SCGC-AAA259E19]
MTFEQPTQVLIRKSKVDSLSDMPSKFCYKCGALEEEKGPLLEGLCKDCFLEKNPLLKVPEEVEMEICDRCGAFYLENAWHDLEGRPTEEYLEAAKEMVTSVAEVFEGGPAGSRYVNFEDSEGVDIGFKAERPSPETINISVEVRGRFFDSQEEPLSDRAEVKVKLKRTTCGVCERLASGYYEAILQVRGREEISEEKISEIFRSLEEEVGAGQSRSRDEFVSKVKRKHGGLDLYVSSAKLARDLARFLKREYGAEMSESAELIGQTEDGEENYRVTVVARMPF